MTLNLSKLRINFDITSSPYPDGLPKTQSSNDPEQLIQDSLKVAPLVKDIVRAVIQTANDDLAARKYTESIKLKSLRKGPPKTIERIKEKAANEYEGNFTDIRDINRQEMDLRVPEQIAAFCSVLDWAAHEQVELPGGAFVVITENRFKRPTATGYRSHKANIMIPIPNEPGRHHIVELMTVHGGFEEQIKAAKKNRFGLNSHGNYAIERVITGKAKEGVLNEGVADTWRIANRACKMIHAKATRDFEFKMIDFEPFEHLRTQQTIEELEAYCKENN